MIRPILLQMAGFCLAILVGFFIWLKMGLKKMCYVKKRPLPPDILQNPKWGDHKYVQLPGLKMHYIQKGDISKPLMVFLHGFPEFWFSWRHQIEHFSQNYW